MTNLFEISYAKNKATNLLTVKEDMTTCRGVARIEYRGCRYYTT